MVAVIVAVIVAATVTYGTSTASSAVPSGNAAGAAATAARRGGMKRSLPSLSAERRKGAVDGGVTSGGYADMGPTQPIEAERNILQILDLRPCESVLDLRGEIGRFRRRDTGRGCRAFKESDLRSLSAQKSHSSVGLRA